MAEAAQKYKRDSQQKSSFLQQHGSKFLALAFWLILLGGYWLYVQQNDLTLTDSAEQMATAVTDSIFGPIFFILIYWLAPDRYSHPRPGSSRIPH